MRRKKKEHGLVNLLAVVRSLVDERPSELVQHVLAEFPADEAEAAEYLGVDGLQQSAIDLREPRVLRRKVRVEVGHVARIFLEAERQAQ